MTRINVGVQPSELPNKLLLAEHREITRIPNAILKRRANLSTGLPSTFSLGKGHVRFFYDKVAYLHNRYERIYTECKKRGFHVGYRGMTFQLVQSLFPGCYGFYKEKPEDRALIVERIESKGFSLLL